MHHLRRQIIRGNRGASQIAELVPVLIITFLIFFFPLIDLLFFFVAYSAGGVLNYNQAREAALIPSTTPGYSANARAIVLPRLQGVTHNWATGGLGRFIKVVDGEGGITTTITTIPATPQAPPDPPFTDVRVSTSFKVQPFIIVPFIPNVPGLSVPAPLFFATDRPIEQ